MHPSRPAVAGLVPALVSVRNEYDHLFHIYMPIAIAVGVIVLSVILFTVLRYRGRPREEAARWHENNPLEISYAVFLACIVGFLLYETFTTEHQVDTVANQQRPSVTIDVTAAKWEWTFSYPAYRITLRSGTTGDNAFVVPANEPVRFVMNSVDVIHAFWLPEVRYKRAVIPGATQSQILVFPPGFEQGQCAVYCGLHHADMVFKVYAVSATRFAAWARSTGAAKT